MRLELSYPPGWRRVDSPGRRMLHVPDEGAGEIRVVLLDVAPLPDDPPAWIRGQLAGARVTSASEQVLSSGWPALVVEAEEEGDRIVVVLWHLLDSCAVALARGPAAAYAARRDELLAILGTATVDWGEPPLLALAQIWDGLDES